MSPAASCPHPVPLLLRRGPHRTPAEFGEERDRDRSSPHRQGLAYRYAIYCAVIRSFRCRDTERLADGYRVRRFAAFERVAQRKLAQLDAAATLDFLRVPPGNRLESLKGERHGSYSVRINDQWRLCFRFQDGNAFDAEIVDYH